MTQQEFYDTLTDEQKKNYREVHPYFRPKLKTIEQLANSRRLNMYGKNGMIEIRSEGEYTNTAFFLTSLFDWEIVKDSDGFSCLIPSIK